MIFIRELLIPGNVLDPLILLVMNIDGGDLDEFIEGQDRRDRDDRKLPHESREKAERHDHAPERDTVADHAELRISARREDAADNCRIQRVTDDIVGAQKEHPLKIPVCYGRHIRRDHTCYS